ncbi:hypothetical protein LguiB_025018 [Lonicera macranthoides]
MKEGPTPHLSRLAEFLGCPFSLDEEKEGVMDSIIESCSFSNLELKRPESCTYYGIDHQLFFWQGEVGDWQNYLTPKMVDRFDKMS